MDTPKDDVQLVPFNATTEDNGTTNAASIKPVTKSEIEAEEGLPLIHEKKETIEYKEIWNDDDDDAEKGQFDESVICDMLKANSDKLIPMFKDTLLAQHKLVS